MGITKVRLTKADIIAAVRDENYGDSDLSNFANLSGSGLIERKSEGVIETVPVTDYIKTLLNDATAADARSTMGLGSMATASTSSYQPIGNELTAIQALSDTPGFLKKTGDGSYSIDNNNYLPLSGGTLTGVTIFSNATSSTSTTTGAIRAASLGITGAIFAGSLNGNGSGLTSLNASNISTGTLNAARLPASYLPLSGGTVTGVTNFSLDLSVQGRQFVGGSTDPYVPTAGTSLIAREVGDTFIGAHNPGGGVIIIGWDRSEDRGTIAVDGSHDIVFITDMSGGGNADNLSGKTPKLVIKGGGNVGIGTASPSQKLEVNGSAKATSFFVGANQVVSAQRTGYTPSTGTLSRGAFNTETVTLLELARQFHALRTDLTTHGLIGA